MGSERVQPPPFPYGTELHDDRVGMSVEELLERGLKALEELVEEEDRLHRHLPRKFEDRVRGLRENRSIVAECIRGGRDKAKISGRALEGRSR